MRLFRAAAVLGTLAVLSVVAAPNAEARPQYLKEFANKYPSLKDQATTAKCTVCHFGESKKNNNDYGAAIKAGLGEGKNVKDVPTITKAYDDAATKPSKTAGKTFGDLINDGKLPGTNPE